MYNDANFKPISAEEIRYLANTIKTTSKIKSDDDIVTTKLKELGFRIFEKEIVKINNNIVEEIPIEELNSIISRNIDNWGLKTTYKRNALINKNNQLNLLDELQGTFLRDTKDKIYFYFANYILEITRDKIIKRDYSEITELVWKSKIKDFPFDFELLKEYTYQNNPDEPNTIEITDDFKKIICEKSIFAVFTQRICTDPITKRFDAERLNVTITSLGYLISQYKTQSYAKMIFLTELNKNKTAAGRTGKGLLINAISYVRNVLKITQKQDNMYEFDNYTYGTDVVFINEVGEKFNIDKMYDAADGTFVVREKFKNELHIPFENSPKFAFASNYIPVNFHDSTTDRLTFLELYRYYNAKHKPTDDFEKEFWTEFDKTDWTLFYAFLGICSSSFIANKNKITDYEPETIRERALTLNLGDELNGIFNDLPKNEFIYNTEFKTKFEGTDYGKCSLQYLKNKLEYYCTTKGYELKSKHSGTIKGRGIIIENITNITN